LTIKKNILNQKKPAPKLLSAAETSSYAHLMTRSVDLSEAGANLPQLAQEVAAGEEIVVTHSGKSLMKLVPIDTESSDSEPIDRKLGFAADLLTDFSWEEWEASHEEFRKLFRDYEDFK
jgi:antitoxin (DNA-binding transcriptional repressor) of toxin-antitoxin stability system